MLKEQKWSTRDKEINNIYQIYASKYMYILTFKSLITNHLNTSIHVHAIFSNLESSQGGLEEN